MYETYYKRAQELARPIGLIGYGIVLGFIGEAVAYTMKSMPGMKDLPIDVAAIACAVCPIALGCIDLGFNLRKKEKNLEKMADDN